MHRINAFKSIKIDKLLDALSGMGVPGLDLSIRLHGEEVYRRMDGHSDVQRQKPMEGTERYNLYSCSKPITCVAGMQLYEQGKFSMTDNLSEYLPEFTDMGVLDGTIVRPSVGDIKIAHLFTMTAGFTYNLKSNALRQAITNTHGLCPTREVIRNLAGEPLAFDPGRNYEYSLCHDVLAALIEEISGQRFSEYVKEHIFDILEMDHSTFLPTSDDVSSLAAQYRYNYDNEAYESVGGDNEYRLGTQYESGGAGCISTVDDYSKFLEALRKGNVLINDETLRMMTTNQLTDFQLGQYKSFSMGYGYGYGVRCEVNGSGATDFGWGGAAGALVGCDRQNDFTFVYMQHVLNMPNFDARKVIPMYIREAINE